MYVHIDSLQPISLDVKIDTQRGERRRPGWSIKQRSERNPPLEKSVVCIRAFSGLYIGAAGGFAAEGLKTIIIGLLARVQKKVNSFAIKDVSTAQQMKI